MTSTSHRLSDLAVQALDGAGGVDDFAQLRGESKEGNDLFPVAPPRLRDGRVFAPAGALAELLQALQGELGTTPAFSFTHFLIVPPQGVRRAKAALSSECEYHPANAPKATGAGWEVTNWLKPSD